MNIVNKKIDSVTEFKKDGSINLLRIRVELENNEIQVIHIQKVKYVTEDKREKTRKFTCEIVLNNTKRLCEIIYKLDTMEWFLYRI